MADGEWQPGNVLEQAMVEALHNGQWRRYADLLGAEPLLVADPPASGTESERHVSGLLPPGARYVLVYTSEASLVWALGGHSPGYQTLDLAALRQRWPGPEHQLAINAGTPIGVYLPLPGLDQLAAGEQSLVSMDEVRRVAADEATAQLRAACLRDLAETSQAAGSAGGPAAESSAGPPAGELDDTLRQAVDAQDSDAFLAALLSAEVVLPTTATVGDPELLYEEDFPWRFAGGEQAPAVAVFSSEDLLARAGAAGVPRLRAHFLDVLANWPGEHYALVLNPGSVTELVLPGQAVRELLDAVLAQVQQAQPAAPEQSG